MTSIIIVLAAFFIMYLIVFLRQIKRKKENEFSSVEEFHKSYDRYRAIGSDRETLHKYRRNYNQSNSGKSSSKSGYTYKYVTKYNNPEDYREKRQ